MSASLYHKLRAKNLPQVNVASTRTNDDYPEENSTSYVGKGENAPPIEIKMAQGVREHLLEIQKAKDTKISQK